MSLKPSAIPPVSAMTAQVARAAFPKGNPYLTLRDELGVIFDDVDFSTRDCHPCPMRALCTCRQSGVRRLKLQPQAQQVALQQARQHHANEEASEEGKKLYRLRGGIEGTFSQTVRSLGLCQTAVACLAQTHLQHVVTAATLNLDRLVAWLQDLPRATTRLSRFAALAPA